MIWMILKVWSVSKNGGISVANGHRSRLLNQDYTSGECSEILSNLGLGYTADQAAKESILVNGECEEC